MRELGRFSDRWGCWVVMHCQESVSFCVQLGNIFVLSNTKGVKMVSRITRPRTERGDSSNKIYHFCIQIETV